MCMRRCTYMHSYPYAFDDTSTYMYTLTCSYTHFKLSVTVILMLTVSLSLSLSLSYLCMYTNMCEFMYAYADTCIYTYRQGPPSRPLQGPCRHPSRASESCVKEPQEQLQVPRKDMSYKEVRNDSVAFIDRRRDTSGHAPMDTGKQKEDTTTYYCLEFHCYGGFISGPWG